MNTTGLGWINWKIKFEKIIGERYYRETIMNTKIARSIETTVLSKFLEKMNSSKDSFSTVDEVYKMMESLKKTEFITEDEIIRLGKKRKPYRVAPKNSWMLFLQKYREENPGNGKSGKEISQEASNKWKSMSNDDKQPYTDEAEKLMSDWKIKIKADKPDEKTDDTPITNKKMKNLLKRKKRTVTRNLRKIPKRNQTLLIVLSI